MSATRTRRGPAPTRSVEQVLAHAHLRMGDLALARVELETLGGLGALDTVGLVDLAEVRWRTGDLVGAGAMAAAALVDQGQAPDPVALVVASEAASLLGRPSEARRLASLAIARAPDTIDAIFAGMPRSGVWAADAMEPAPTAPTLFDRGPAGPGPEAIVEPAADTAATGGTTAGDGPVSMTPGFWDGDQVLDPDVVAMPDPALEFEAGRVALVAGTLDEAAFRLGLALRLAPALAPAVLEATEGARASSLMVVRGDACRLSGHEAEARRAYAIAARGGLPERRTRVRVKSRTKVSLAADVTDDLVDKAPAVDEAPAIDGLPVADEAPVVDEAHAVEDVPVGDAVAEDPPPVADDVPPAADETRPDEETQIPDVATAVEVEAEAEPDTPSGAADTPAT